MTDDFVHRACPSCGRTDAPAEVASLPPAEGKSFEELRPYWSGLFKEKLFFSYHRCAGCGLLYAPVFFSQPGLAELYASMAPNMELVPATALEATQRGYWEAAANGARLDGDYLEIGPDIGLLARHAATQGRFRHMWLVEPNRAVHDALSAAAGAVPHSIITDMDDLSAVPEGAVGLAVMIHVLDHLSDPLAALERLYSRMRPDGRLAIVTHNEASLLRTLMRNRWPPFCLQHPQLFNPRSITALLGRAGFRVASVGRSRNYFPVGFMLRQAAYSVGLDLTRVPLPATAIGLRLGNMITVAER